MPAHAFSETQKKLHWEVCEMHDQHKHHRRRSDLQVVVGSWASRLVTFNFINVHTFGGRGSPAF